MKSLFPKLLLPLLLLLLLFDSAYAVRVKDLAAIRGGRVNQLIGYSIVIGLNGSGDSVDSILSRRPLINALERMGMKFTEEDIRGRGIAAVIVTATLPAFAKQGQRLDVVVSALGDAISLRGGVLVMTPLRGPDKETYALAQGLLTAIPQGVELPEGITTLGTQKLNLDPRSTTLPTVGRVLNGAIVEKEIEIELNTRTRIYLNLFEPDFTSAFRLAKIINRHMGDGTSKASDAGTVEVTIPQTYLGHTVELMAKIENLEIEPDVPARVTIDEGTGTIVMGPNVKVLPVAIAHKNLKITIDSMSQEERKKREEELKALYSDPNARPSPDLLKLYDLEQFIEEDKVVVLNEGVDLKDLVDGLNKIGVTDRELIDILKLIKTAGALKAELITN